MRTPKIVKLANSTLSEIKRKQNSSTDQSRRDALNEIKVVVDDLSSTDEAIIQAFRTAIHKVKTQGKFGFRGERRSTFLNKAQGFLEKIQSLQEDKKSLSVAHSNPVESKAAVNHDSATEAECFPGVLQDLILQYLDDKQVGDNKRHDLGAYKSLCQHGFFLKKVDALYKISATEIAHDLLRRIDVEKNLQILAKSPQYLMIEIAEVISRRGQRIQAVTILQALCMAGACNPRKLRPDEKNYGLVERVYECFPDYRVADQQIEILRSRGFDAATELTMRPVKKAIHIMFEIIEKNVKIINSPEQYQALFDLYVPGFKAALVPDSKYIVRSGFLFDISIFKYFFDRWKEYSEESEAFGGWCSIKSNLAGAIIYPRLQECTDPGDLELFNTGIGNVLSGLDDAPLPSSRDMPENLAKFFSNSFFGLNGNKCLVRETPTVCVCTALNMLSAFGTAPHHFRRLYQAKKHQCLRHQDSMLDKLRWLVG